VLLFFDIGGSMDWHIKRRRKYFQQHEVSSSTWSTSTSIIVSTSACEGEPPRWNDCTPTGRLHTYPHDYKVIFVGDAAMSPYEISAPGGSVEHFNEEPGTAWMERVTRTIRRACGSTRCRRRVGYTGSIRMMQQLVGEDVSADARGTRSGDAGVGE